jgi:hypothetical protein
VNNILRHQGILELIRTLLSTGESGRLQISAGSTEGAFFFKNGKLVDARVGDLTGFQAVNAATSMRDAGFSFDPAVAPPPVSSITPNERIVLKQFFGIESVDPRELISDEEDEVTLITSRLPRVTTEVPRVTTEVPSAEIPVPVAYIPPSRPIYRSGLLIAVLLVLVAAGTFAIVYRYYADRSLRTASTAVTVESPPVPEQVKHVEPVKLVEQAKLDDQVASAGQDLTGKWNVVNTVQKTSYRSFKNLEIGFDLSINQSGKGFTGKGEKVSENGRSLPTDSRTPIQVKGSINGDRIEATFFEEGAVRKTNGRFVWRIDRAGGKLTGTFVSTAARTSGKSAARKEL